MSTLMSAGITGATVRRALTSGMVKQLSRGTYRLAEAASVENLELAPALARIPRGLICLLSAAKAHGLTDEAPSEVWVAIHNRENTPEVDFPPIRIVRWADKRAFAFGIETQEICGVAVRITTPARTVVDMLRMGHLVRLGASFHALGRYLDSGGVPSDLLEASDQLGVLKRLEPLLRFGIGEQL